MPPPLGSAVAAVILNEPADQWSEGDSWSVLDLIHTHPLILASALREFHLSVALWHFLTVNIQVDGVQD